MKFPKTNQNTLKEIKITPTIRRISDFKLPFPNPSTRTTTPVINVSNGNTRRKVILNGFLQDEERFQLASLLLRSEISLVLGVSWIFIFRTSELSDTLNATQTKVVLHAGVDNVYGYEWVTQFMKQHRSQGLFAVEKRREALGKRLFV